VAARLARVASPALPWMTMNAVPTRGVTALEAVVIASTTVTEARAGTTTTLATALQSGARMTTLLLAAGTMSMRGLRATILLIRTWAGSLPLSAACLMRTTEPAEIRTPANLTRPVSTAPATRSMALQLFGQTRVELSRSRS